MAPSLARVWSVPNSHSSFTEGESSANGRIKNELFADQKFGPFQSEDIEIRGSRWQNCHWDEIRCRSLTFAGVEWLGGTLKSVHFKDCLFSNCVFLYVELVDVIFENCHFEHGYFFDRNFHGCAFLHCDFYNIDFTMAQFSRVNLASSHWTQCRLDGANFTDANLSDAKVVSGSWRDVQLEGALLTGAELPSESSK